MPETAVAPAPARAAAVAVRPVESASDLAQFIDFPYRLYRDYPFWVAPLRRDTARALSPKRNAFFQHGRMQTFLARGADGAVVGRIAAIVNGKHLEKYADGNGFFGFFECADNQEAAFALFAAAEAWLAAQGLSGVRGPTNPTMNDICGLLVGGFDREPSVMMPYNPPYYAAFLEAYGFRRAMTMWAYYVHKKYVRTDKLKRGIELLRRRHPTVTLRTVDMKRFDEDAKAILDIYNDAWSRNWGHVPMTEAEFKQLTHEMKSVVDPNIVYLLEDDGKPFAFSISLPNVNQLLRHVRDGRLFPSGLAKLLAYGKLGHVYECRTLLMGIMQAYQGKGFDVMMNYETITQGPRHGYDASEMSWVLDVNEPLKNAVASLGGVVDKEYAMYEKAIG